MNQSPITLNHFFSFEGEELPQDSLSGIESSEKISSLREAFSRETKGIKWSVAFREMIKQIADLLNIGVPDIMVKAWNKYSLLLKYSDRKKYSPDEIFLVPLAEHTIKSEHHPYLEILINNQTVGKMVFDINISLMLEGIILKIQDGKIKEILTGSCKGKGTIKHGDFVIFEKASGSISLPGSMDLGEGLPIKP